MKPGGTRRETGETRRRGTWKLATAFGFAVCLSPATPGLAADPAPQETPSVAVALAKEVRSVFERVREGVVKIEGTDESGPLVGTGFFIDPNGTLLTSYSVGGESINLVVSYGERRCPAKRLTADSRSGIAILKLEKNAGSSAALPFLPLGESASLEVASPVIMVAYSMDLPLAPHFGMIAGFERKYLNRYFATTHIRANVPVKRGEGGAPLLNMKGEVVGVVISSVDGGSSCFALPAEAVNKVHQDYVRFGGPRPGWLGMKVHPVPAAGPLGSTVGIQHLEDDGPAGQAGLAPGDILQRIGKFEIRAPEDVLNASFFLSADEKVEIDVWRKGEAITVELQTAGRKPVAATPRSRTLKFQDAGLKVTAPTPGDFMGGRSDGKSPFDDITLRPEEDETP